MANMWAGRTDGATDRIADDFNTSICFDSRMFRQDIKGSMAHAAMLAAQGIIEEDEAMQLSAALKESSLIWKAVNFHLIPPARIYTCL